MADHPFILGVDLLRSELKEPLQTSYINRYQRSNFIDLTVKEKEENRLLRAELNSRDGGTLESHDQFSSDYRLFFNLFRIMGLLPLTRSGPGRYTFAWRSLVAVYTVLMWGLLTILVLVVGRERFHILQTTTHFDEYIYAILFVLYLIPHFWIPLIVWAEASEVAFYINSWGPFQLRFYRVTGTSLHFPGLKSIILIICVCCFLVSISFLVCLSFLMEGYPLLHTLAYYHIITMLNMSCALMYINTRAIKMASSQLSTAFHKDATRHCNATIISQYRFLWINLSEILQTLGKAYSRTYCALCIFIFVNIVISVYGTFAELIDSAEGNTFSYQEMGLVINIVYCGGIYFLIGDCSGSATKMVSKGVQRTLLSMNLLKVDLDTKIEIDFFIVAMELNPAIVNLKGYVILNREVLSSSIAMIAVYILVLIQFKYSLEQNRKQEAIET